MTTKGCRWSCKNRVSTARQMTAVEAAWVGAMIEAEGHIGLRSRGEGYTPAANFCVTNTSIEILSTLLRLTGVGRVYFCPDPRPDKLGHLPVWRWHIIRKEDMVAVGGQIRPYLVDKQDRLAHVMEQISDDHS